VLAGAKRKNFENFFCQIVEFQIFLSKLQTLSASYGNRLKCSVLQKIKTFIILNKASILEGPNFNPTALKRKRLLECQILGLK
jgi:hypothetical protein